MLCLACARPGWPLCLGCERDLVVAPDRVVGGVTVGVAYLHTATAVRLVHNLKYRRSTAAGRFLAAAMAERLPGDASVLVPVARSPVRRVPYGIDQAAELARAVGRVVGLPVSDAVAAPLWWQRRAGAGRDRRRPVPFGARRDVPDGAVLVDDVLTTGATVLSAGRAIAPAKFSVLVATAAGTMRAGTEEVPKLGGDVATERRTNAGRSHAALEPSRSESPDGARADRARRGGIIDREEHG